MGRDTLVTDDEWPVTRTLLLCRRIRGRKTKISMPAGRSQRRLWLRLLPPTDRCLSLQSVCPAKHPFNFRAIREAHRMTHADVTPARQYRKRYAHVVKRDTCRRDDLRVEPLTTFSQVDENVHQMANIRSLIHLIEGRAYARWRIAIQHLPLTRSRFTRAGKSSEDRKVSDDGSECARDSPGDRRGHRARCGRGYRQTCPPESGGALK
jgi:hypothetical protein